MKKYLLSIIVAGAMTSCSLVKSYSSKTAEITPNVDCKVTEAELNISSQKSNGTCLRQKGLSFKEMQANAIANALEKTQGDVLVEPRFIYERKRSGKIKAVYVTGYPATYKNFTPVSITTSSK